MLKYRIFSNTIGFVDVIRLKIEVATLPPEEETPGCANQLTDGFSLSQRNLSHGFVTGCKGGVTVQDRNATLTRTLASKSRAIQPLAHAVFMNASSSRTRGSAVVSAPVSARRPGQISDARSASFFLGMARRWFGFIAGRLGRGGITAAAPAPRAMGVYEHSARVVMPVRVSHCNLLIVRDLVEEI